MADAKLQRTVQRFESKISLGAYYEAHQTLRTIINRYVKASQYTEAIDLLVHGAALLQKNSQYAMSSDLISYLVQVFEEARITSADKKYKSQLIELVFALPDTESSLVDLAKQCVSWSLSEDNKFGDCEIHHVFGMKVLNLVKRAPVSSESSIKTEEEKQNLFHVAELHLILGTFESVPAYVDYLFQWWCQSKDTDAGIFLSRAVINYAYLRNITFMRDAQAQFISMLKEECTKYETVGGEVVHFLKHPFVTFLQLLTLTLSKEKAQSSTKFMKLYTQYKPQLEKYELLGPVEYLGKLYFDLKLGKPSGNNNMLAEMMGGLFS